ncbi:UNVERIFIED_CONTAM: DnaJ domain-containing protein [Hammondia hammondi]|eukprot:XP_008889213.1 DnaJ domain-containing protein [Hammondia hammondi]
MAGQGLARRFVDCYKVLGLHPTCTDAEIKKKFAELAKQLHPDSGSASQCRDKFQAVTEAYKQLTANRREYDALYELHAGLGSRDGFSSMSGKQAKREKPEAGSFFYPEGGAKGGEAFYYGSAFWEALHAQRAYGPRGGLWTTRQAPSRGNRKLWRSLDEEDCFFDFEDDWKNGRNSYASRQGGRPRREKPRGSAGKPESGQGLWGDRESEKRRKSREASEGAEEGERASFSRRRERGQCEEAESGGERSCSGPKGASVPEKERGMRWKARRGFSVFEDDLHGDEFAAGSEFDPEERHGDRDGSFEPRRGSASTRRDKGLQGSRGKSGRRHPGAVKRWQQWREVDVCVMEDDDGREEGCRQQKKQREKSRRDRRERATEGDTGTDRPCGDARRSEAEKNEKDRRRSSRASAATEVEEGDYRSRRTGIRKGGKRPERQDERQETRSGACDRSEDCAKSGTPKGELHNAESRDEGLGGDEHSREEKGCDRNHGIDTPVSKADDADVEQTESCRSRREGSAHVAFSENDAEQGELRDAEKGTEIESIQETGGLESKADEATSRGGGPGQSTSRNQPEPVAGSAAYGESFAELEEQRRAAQDADISKVELEERDCTGKSSGLEEGGEYAWSRGPGQQWKDTPHYEATRGNVCGEKVSPSSDVAEKEEGTETPRVVNGGESPEQEGERESVEAVGGVRHRASVGGDGPCVTGGAEFREDESDTGERLFVGGHFDLYEDGGLGRPYTDGRRKRRSRKAFFDSDSEDEETVFRWRQGEVHDGCGGEKEDSSSEDDDVGSSSWRNARRKAPLGDSDSSDDGEGGERTRYHSAGGDDDEGVRLGNEKYRTGSWSQGRFRREFEEHKREKERRGDRRPSGLKEVDVYTLASTPRKKGKRQVLPRMTYTDRCGHGNRVEGILFLDETPIRDWLKTYGDRGRVYGVYRDGAFLYSLEWKKKKHWGKVAEHARYCDASRMTD